MREILFSAFAVALLAQTSASGAAELLDNGSFETGTGLAYNSYRYPAANDVPGWTFGGAAVANSSSAWASTTASPFAGLGSIYAALQNTSSFSTVFTSPTAAAILSWWDAGRPSNGGYGGNQSYTVSVTTSGGGTVWTGNYSTASGSAARELFADLDLVAGSLYALTFTGHNAVGDATAFIDGVSVASIAVPGPIAGAGLPMLLGLAGLAVRRRRRAA